SLLPALCETGWTAAIAFAGEWGRTWLSRGDWADCLVALWLAGLAAHVALASWRQARFEAAVRAGLAGPAVVGVFVPRMVAPADIALRHDEAERRLIRAHERAHMERGDVPLRALATAASWLCWFNPLVHLAVAAFAEDQELACDATVMEQLPRSRRAYALALLHSRPEARCLAFGATWRAGAHPLEARIAMLSRRPLRQGRHTLGFAALVALCTASFGAAWATSPDWPPFTASRAPRAAILMDLAPVPAAETAWVYRSLPRGGGGR
ncbi:MAG: M56 family metallopeptidase, partial [Caulobacteraceae bacterium]